MYARSLRLPLAILVALTLSACGGGNAASDEASAPPPDSGGAGTATLQWSSPGDPRVAGYRVYYGTSSRAYDQAKGEGLNAGGGTRLDITNLQPGQTYYFAVTAYDASQNESDYSAEVSKTVN